MNEDIKKNVEINEEELDEVSGGVLAHVNTKAGINLAATQASVNVAAANVAAANVAAANVAAVKAGVSIDDIGMNKALF